MKVSAAGEYGFQVTRKWILNAYLVRESDGWTVVDTTISGAAPDLLSAASSQAGASGDGAAAGTADRVRRILLTHAHGDHVGSVDELARSAGDLHLAISAREACLLPKPPAQDRALEPDEPQCKLKGGFPGIETHPTHLVRDGELFGSLRCLATPGHTPGHFSFLDERDGTLYAGDSLITMGGGLHVSGFGPWFFPLPALATWHRPTALESAKRLLDRVGPAIRRYASGHGRLVEGGADLLRKAIAKAEGKLR